MKKKILLTGSNGFIGKNIKESFLNDKYELITPSSKELNLIDTDCVDNYFKDKTFYAVLHAGTKPGHRNAKDPTNLFYSNVRMFMNLERHKDKYEKFINFGSGAVFDVSKDNFNVKETDIFKNFGKDDHSYCKYVVQKLINNLDGFVDLNIFGIFGKYEDWEIRFISNAICKAMYNLPITLRQNRRFSYLFVEDLMPILDYFIENDAKYKSYNVTPDGFVELKQMAEIVKELSGKDIPINIANEGYGLNYTGCNERLKSEIADLHFTKTEDSVSELINYYETIKNKIDIRLLLSDK